MTLNLSADYSHQTGIFDPSRVSTPITMIGCGGIGASVLPTLLTLGFKHFVLWDADHVEPRNVTTNLIFRERDIMRPKVDRVKEYLLEYGGAGVTVEAHEEAYTGQQQLGGIVISGVDSMTVRQQLWKEHIALNGEVVLYLDGRIGGQHATLLCLGAFDFTKGALFEEHYLYDDSDAMPLPCTQRTVVHPAVALGAYMAACLSKWSRGEEVPFKTDVGFDGEFFFQSISVPEEGE